MFTHFTGKAFKDFFTQEGVDFAISKPPRAEEITSVIEKAINDREPQTSREYAALISDE